ncbi:YlbL family protein [Leucobacter sp. HY1908]
MNFEPASVNEQNAPTGDSGPANEAKRPGKLVRLWRRTRALVRANRTETVMGLVAIAVLLAATVPSPYAIERPGPVVDVLGTVQVEGEDVPVLTVEGQKKEAQDAEAAGALNLLTVQITGSPQKPLNWAALIPALFDPSQSIAPVTNFYPEGITVEQREKVTSMQMDNSQVQAAAAAFAELGLPVKVALSVDGVDEHGAAAGLLEAGDELVSVGGAPLESFDDLNAAVSASDGEIEIGIRREGKDRSVRVTPQPQNPGGDPRLGVVIASSFELPREVDISVPQIGGPSAGLIFGLAIMDRLGDSPELGGLAVSGTGTLTAKGEVGPIGGLTQKAWAAKRAGSDLFLMPVANCADVEGFPKELRVAPVATLAEAAAAIDTAASGGQVAGLERCSAGGVAEG